MKTKANKASHIILQRKSLRFKLPESAALVRVGMADWRAEAVKR